MNEHELKESLQELQHELLYRDTVSDEQMIRLKQFRQDIDDFVERIETDSHDTHTFRERLIEMETEFGNEHPVLERLFLETIESLAKMGV